MPASLAIALLAGLATVAFATSVPTDPTETVTAVTVNGADPAGDYVATSDVIVLEAGIPPPVGVDCTSVATFTIDADGTGEITELWFETCITSGFACVVNDLATAGPGTTPVTIANGGFTVTGSTGTGVTAGATSDPTTGTFVLDGNGTGPTTAATPGGGGATTATTAGTRETLADISFTVVCPAIGLDCAFTTPTTDDSGTFPLSAMVDEGAPAFLTFAEATIDGDTDVTCADPELTGVYALGDPTTTPGPGTTASTPGDATDTPIAAADDVTVSP